MIEKTYLIGSNIYLINANTQKYSTKYISFKILPICKKTNWAITSSTATTTTPTTYLLSGCMQHRHMDTNHTYKYTIRWLTEKPNIHVHVKTNKKNTTCTDRDTKLNVDYTS